MDSFVSSNKGQKLDTTCLDIEKPIKIQCETQLLNGDINISLEPKNLISQQNTCTENLIGSKLNTFCSSFNKSDQCEFNVLDFISENENCYVTRKTITVTYLCSGTNIEKTSNTIVYENVNDDTTTTREPQDITSSIQQTESTYESLSSNRNSIDHMYESTKRVSKVTDLSQYVSITNPAEYDIHNYESTEPELTQYQSLTSPSESDIHTYDSTNLDLSQYQSLANPSDSDIHNYASTISLQ
ncbi:unnamed protein product [Mytilus edulis]|uniref:Uncharacterized protein n=1 Tax=Mytilus edulis TaxID=6550 RepID=A0A8S3TY14_MYTED|nr:unnamed protein product [Mytilus edulis]